MDTGTLTWILLSMYIFLCILVIYFYRRILQRDVEQQKLLLIATMERLGKQTDWLIVKLNDYFKLSATLRRAAYLEPPVEQYFITLQQIKSEIVNKESVDFVGKLSSLKEINTLLKNTTSLLSLTEKINLELDQLRWAELSSLN